VDRLAGFKSVDRQVENAMKLCAALMLVIIVATVQVAAADKILVYDDNTQHQLALQAAVSSPGAVVVRANSVTFGPLLRSRTWDLVLADMPSTEPDVSGFSALTDYVNGGGRAVMSFWEWQKQPLSVRHSESRRSRTSR
jgi:hypothetical protein